ncbi:MAG: sodium:solute symporter, partial [Candidatus Eremiobacteraeota bacterium]|nr:sodium:solute symporter [Candidatus Eremiobacteraeota bacterium]
PYTILVYPLMFAIMPRLWSVAKRHGHVTLADFTRDRYGSQSLALIVALTGILAIMPYIALQLVGIQVVVGELGARGTGLRADLPVVIAFAILAAYTYVGGLRAPALIAFVKDALIYVTVIAAVIVIPHKLGGYAHVFAVAERTLAHRPTPGGLILPPRQFTAYATLALGSALALFMYPHSITSVLSCSDRNVIKRNAALLPAYSFLLGLIALLGYMAIAAGVKPVTASYAVPDLFVKMFPGWFVGVAFAAIAIGALVPAAIMSIAAANLFTRSIYRPYVRQDCSARGEADVAKLSSLLIKAGALAFVLWLPTDYAIDLQLLAGGWILQIFPTVALGLYGRWLHRWALLAGWMVGMVSGTLMAMSQGFKSIYPLHVGGMVIPGFAAFYALLLNLATAALLSVVFHASGVSNGIDKTSASDYGEALAR